MRWESRMTFSRESFTVPLRRSQDDALLPRQLLLHHLEHLGVGDVRPLHLGSMLDEDLADLLVQLVLDHELVGDHPADGLHHAGAGVHLELAFRGEGLHDLAGDVLDLVGGQPHRRVSITYCGQGPGIGAEPAAASRALISAHRSWSGRSMKTDQPGRSSWRITAHGSDCGRWTRAARTIASTRSRSSALPASMTMSGTGPA